MKKILNPQLFILSAIVLTMVLSGCVKQDYKNPDMLVPEFPETANITIANLIGLNSDVDSLFPITGDTIIEGVVTGNDESGNIYKYMVIQDETAGIIINVDISDYYNEYKIGQRVFVKCKGLVFGYYGGSPQLGMPYYDGGWKVGRIPAVYLKNHLFRDSLLGPAITPKIMANFNDISLAHPGDKNKLVTFTNVSFPDAGKSYSEKYETTDRPLKDYTGAEIIVRTSNYADFALDILPAGKGKITGILGYYNSTYQLIIRDINEVTVFKIDTNPEPDTIGTAFPFISGMPLNTLTEYFNSAVTNVDVSIPHWTNTATMGSRKWRGKVFGSEKYIQATTYGASDINNICWLISPAIYFSSNKTLSFKSAISYWNHTNLSGLTVWILYNFDGHSGVWKKIDATLANQNNANYSWVSSGNIDLSQYLPAGYNGDVYIGFRAVGSSTQTTTFQLDDVVVQ
ncbi:MAG: hypothetical protein A2491_15560 [Bacteroidetes bacterium RIFOXYC12_FULL_35_7]|nr:MAG: hypothetical protein A2491_15560 [Bacteroidetes bacterium RIFOXYC12_FULL_35_7]